MAFAFTRLVHGAPHRRRRTARSRRWLLTQGVLTTLGLAIVAIIVVPLARFVLYDAEWGVVAANLRLFGVGLYAPESIWRISACLIGVAGLLGLSTATSGVARSLAPLLAVALGALAAAPLAAEAVRSEAAGAVLAGPLARLIGPLPQSSLFDVMLALRPALGTFAIALAILTGARLLAKERLRRGDWDGAVAQARLERRLRWAWLALGLAGLVLIRGLTDSGLLAIVPPRDWGGLLLTGVLSVVALTAAFPLGIALALGRRSSLPLVRGTCIAYIEIVRGVPLVTILFLSQVMLPLVLPAGPWLDRVFRAMVGLALFTAAYLAEDVRGGLAAVGRGQMEAARAVGLGSGGAYRLVVLPQALRVVVPSLVGQFIALFKDTSLAQIVGLNELLGISVAVVAQPAWRGHATESLLFAAAIYFSFSYAMTRVSRQMEQRERMAA